MINLNLTMETQEEIKEIFKKWFFRKSILSEFKEIIDEDSELKRIIFSSVECYENWKEKSDHYVLEQLFFADFSKGDILKKYVIISVNILKERTKVFFLKKYENFRRSKGAQFVRALNVTVCPYCNRNYLELYHYKNDQGTKHIFKGDLDHYYSKSLYPHLALSIFNLVPCCKVCNHEKLDNDRLKTFHPYFHNDNYYKFSLAPLTIDDKDDITFEEPIDSLESKINDMTYLQGASDNFKIVLKPVNNEYKTIIENSNAVFRLDKKYNRSKEYVKELLKKRYSYTDSYAEMLYESFGDIFKSPNDVKRLVFSNELDGSNHNHRPLSKITYDILKELEVI